MFTMCTCCTCWTRPQSILQLTISSKLTWTTWQITHKLFVTCPLFKFIAVGHSTFMPTMKDDHILNLHFCIVFHSLYRIRFFLPKIFMIIMQCNDNFHKMNRLFTASHCLIPCCWMYGARFCCCRCCCCRCWYFLANFVKCSLLTNWNLCSI